MIKTFAMAAAGTLLAATFMTFQPQSAAAADETIQRVKSAGELRACFADDNPWAFKNPGSGKWEGFVPDMAHGLAESMEVQLVEIDGNWSTLIQSLLSDQCDLIAAPLFATVKRAEQVLFTDPYASEYVTVYVPTDSEATSYEQIDVEGKVIAVRAGTSPADFATRFFKNAELKTYLADSAMAVLTDVGTKRVDGWLDSVIATGRFLAQNPQYPVRPIGDAPLDPVRLVWAVKPGDYQFQQLINTFLYSYRASGKADVSWTNWFGSVYEPPLQ